MTLQSEWTLQLELEHLRARELARIAALALWVLLRRVPRTLTTWRQRSLQRAALTDLNDHLLRDVGLTRADVRRESSKWFWRP